MTTSEIVNALDAEIVRLQRVRELLAGYEAPAKRRGRPKGTASADVSSLSQEAKPKRREMSAESRARIAAAQRLRWAKQNGSGKGPAPAKKAAGEDEAAPAGRTQRASAKKAARRTARKGGKRAGASPEAQASTPAKGGSPGAEAQGS